MEQDPFLLAAKVEHIIIIMHSDFYFLLLLRGQNPVPRVIIRNQGLFSCRCRHYCSNQERSQEVIDKPCRKMKLVQSQTSVHQQKREYCSNHV